MVKNMDIVPGQIKTSTIELKVTTYIENRGGASGPSISKNTSLLLKATSTDKDFLVNQTTTFAGKIAPDKYRECNPALLLPKKVVISLKLCSLRKVKKLIVDPERFTISKACLPIARLQACGSTALLPCAKGGGGKVVIQSDIYVTTSEPGQAKTTS